MTAPPAAWHGHSKAVVVLGAVLLVAGCAADPAAPPSGSAPSTANAPESLKKAMPAKSDFPTNWQVQTQEAPPVALPGLDDESTVIGAVVPDECQEFAAGFVSAPGSSVPGSFIASTVAMIPNAEGVFDQSSVVVFTTKDAGGWGAPRAIRDSMRTCAKVTAQISMRGQKVSADLSSAPIDTSAIKAEASGRTTLIHASEARIRMAVVHATTRGVLVCASSMIVSESGDDQKTLLVELVARTVDKLNTLR